MDNSGYPRRAFSGDRAGTVRKLSVILEAGTGWDQSGSAFGQLGTVRPRGPILEKRGGGGLFFFAAKKPGG